MKIKISKLGGIINEANIDLSKRFLIFTGPNNSGKTYISQFIYGLFSSNLFYSFNDYFIEYFNEGIYDLVPLVEDNRFENRFKEIDYEEFLNDIFASKQTLFKETIIEYIDYKSDLLEYIKSFNSELTLKLPNGAVTKLIGSKIYYRLGSDFIPISEYIKKKPNEYPDYLYTSVTNIFIKKIGYEDAYIEPTERTSINIFAKQLSIEKQEAFDRFVSIANKNIDARINLGARNYYYPYAINETVKIADSLGVLKKNKSKFDFLAKDLEKKILGGNIGINNEGELIFKPNSKTKLPIQISSSMVKSLSSLVVFFRHMAVGRERIIIDEPELNLHPKHQINLAKFLAKVINNDFKLIISTHSDYIISELNNLISLNTLENRDEILKKYNINQDELLDFNNIKVYHFPEKKNKSKNQDIEEIEVSHDGFAVKHIDEVILTHVKETEEILNAR